MHKATPGPWINSGSISVGLETLSMGNGHWQFIKHSYDNAKGPLG